MSTKKSTKAQAWYMDFTLALIFFTVSFALYFNFLEGRNSGHENQISDVILSAKTISSSLMTTGYPKGWTNNTVIRIGIADDYALNATKVKNFKQMNYTLSKKIMGINHDYFVLFVDSSGNLINIKNICGIGDGLANLTYPLKTAYYYSTSTDSFLKNFMNQTFKSDIYYDNQIDLLLSNLSKYGLVVLEHPAWSGAEISNYDEEFNNYTAYGGLIMLSGEITTSGSGRNMIGMVFDKRSGTSSSEEIARINKSDPYLAFNAGDAIQFNQYFYVTNATPPPISADNPYPASNFSIIATYNQSANSDIALASWRYGNGTAYFFSDFDATFFSGDFLDTIKDFVKTFMPGECEPKFIDNINTSTVNPSDFAKIERYLTYDSQIVKMIVYAWQ